MLKFDAVIFDLDGVITRTALVHGTAWKRMFDDFLKKTSETKMIEMMKYGRHVWKEWLNRDRQPELMAYALEQIKQGKLHR